MSNKVLILRTCKADLTAYNSFQWPESGHVECPDWDPKLECGNGLHGALWGEGDGGLFCWDFDARWLVVEVDADTIVDLGGKVKFPSGNVVHCGDQKSATDYILERKPEKAVIGAFVTAGDHGTATAGEYGTATAGNRGTATAGNRGTATAGYRGTATAGSDGTIQIEYWDGKKYRIKTGYIGEKGLKPNVAYKIGKNNRFVKA